MKTLVNNLLEEAYKKELNNELTDAIRIYENVLNTDSEVFCVYLSLGGLYEKINEESRAVQVYKKGIQVAKQQHSEMVESELLFTLLGLID